MSTNQQPHFTVVGFDSDGRTRYRVQRTADRAVCGVDCSEPYGPPACSGPDAFPRTWDTADEAAAYVAKLEDGTTGTSRADRVAWIDEWDDLWFPRDGVRLTIM